MTPEATRPTAPEFIRALVASSWAHPDALRPVLRPHIALLTAMCAAVAAVLVGMLIHFVHPSTPSIATPRPVAVVPFSAVTGWDCASSATQGFEPHGRTSAWYTVASGGWPADGCDGTFEAVPMSASDSIEVGLWWFTPGPSVTHCDVMVYRARPTRPADAAATAAAYAVLSGQHGPPLGTFTVDQTSAPGTWDDIGTFPVGSDGLAVRLDNEGAPSTSSARLALTQVKITCTS